MGHSAQPPSSSCFLHAFPGHSLAAGLDACEESGLFGTGMWDCLEAKGNNNRAGKQWQDAELFLYKFLFVAVKKFLPKAVVALFIGP